MSRVSILETGFTDSGDLIEKLGDKLEAAGFDVIVGDIEGADLAICVGGDGSFLNTLARFDFPDIPFAGINTGHLGFFQELDEEDIDLFIRRYKGGRYIKQYYRTVSADVELGEERLSLQGLNDVVVKGEHGKLAHFAIYVGERFIEDFVGDGVVVSTPAGSTAYNYSLGGSIVDPDIDLLQLAPIAPLSTAAYRSFTSSISSPPDSDINLVPNADRSAELSVTVDGNEYNCKDVKVIRVRLSKKRVELLRFKDYEFWDTVKRKLLGD
ncbi:MAG: NAD(+)/NADH kinase [Clostridiales Family XIII bacterium]|jgi:NAD+ kinase|nr:NAD(+)/NADH kinase [Clostridiales Family XIII bacterium]